MALLDPFELVQRLGRAPLEPLVDALRQVHIRGTVDATSLEALFGRGEAAPVVPSASHSAHTSSLPDYEQARRHFVRHSERLREQAILAEKLLDGLAGRTAVAPPVILQHEVRVQCAPGGTSAARFVVVNCLKQQVDVRFQSRHVHGLPAEEAESVRLSFNPDHPRLERGAELEVQLLVSLSDTARLPHELEIGVDVCGNELTLLKLWVRIEVRGRGAR
jgi:hypothetical protein